MSSRAQHLIIVGTVILVAVGVTIYLGRTDDIGWVLAIVIVAAHLGVITVLARTARRLMLRSRAKRANVPESE
jgi:membrane protein DedA with SNARE-associated domain